MAVFPQIQMSGHRGWSERLKIVHGQLAIAMMSVPSEGTAELIDLLRIGNGIVTGIAKQHNYPTAPQASCPDI